MDYPNIRILAFSSSSGFCNQHMLSKHIVCVIAPLLHEWIMNLPILVVANTLDFLVSNRACRTESELFEPPRRSLGSPPPDLRGSDFLQLFVEEERHRDATPDAAWLGDLAIVWHLYSAKLLFWGCVGESGLGWLDLVPQKMIYTEHESILKAKTVVRPLIVPDSSKTRGGVLPSPDVSP